MSTPWDWSEEEALDRWLDDLEQAASLEETVRRRLEDSPVEPANSREAAYREAARRWLERGSPRVALSLLERSMGTAEDLNSGPVAQAGRLGGLEAQLDLLLVGRSGSAGLPALTEQEMTALRSADGPAAALTVVQGARRRLEVHGGEARRLLRRWLVRQRGD